MRTEQKVQVRIARPPVGWPSPNREDAWADSGGCGMRGMLILGGVGFLTTAAWTANLDGQAPGRGSPLGSQNGRRLEVQVPVRRYAGGGGRTGRMFFAVEYETVPYPDLYFGAPAPVHGAPGMLAVGGETRGAEHMNAGHFAGSSSRPHAHLPAGVGSRESLVLNADVASAAQSDEAGPATAQPDPTANPYLARPPGAGGPGRPVSGSYGPGLPGPGRPANPEW
jgi:hypothetical protein